MAGGLLLLVIALELLHPSAGGASALATGDTNKAIAAQLVLSVRTIDRHVSNIFTKLGVSTRAAAVARAHELGLL